MTEPVNGQVGATRKWLVLGLLLALVVVPGLVLGFRELGRPGGDAVAFVIELVMFAVTAVALWVARTKAHRSWADLGLAARPWKETVLLTVVGLVLIVAVLAASLGLFALLGWSYGEGDGTERPLWLLTVMIIRAGVVEELVYRAIAIDHLALLSSSRTLAWLLPGVLFGLAHYSQGLPGIIIATVTGFALTALYLWKRNLWANFLIHFIIDFLPNILLPLLGLVE